jgi:hypothetical protein
MDPASATVAELLKLGVPGVVIIGMAVALSVLWKTNVALTNQLAALQEARLADVRKCTEALLTAAQAMEKQSDTMSGIQTTLTNLMAEWASRRRS